MDLDSLLQRSSVVPFAPGTRIPWDDPEFSERMLREHLCQDHDRASRRFGIIDQQVAWVHRIVLGGRLGQILDLGCGPGFYTSRLATLGHRCVGIDFSPASIAYAKAEAEKADLDCSYQLGDLRDLDFGQGFDAVLMLFGEFNTFETREVRSLLVRAASALKESGRLVLEIQYSDYVQALGEGAPTWSAQKAGLFSEKAHLTLRESRWHADEEATTERYFVFRDQGLPSIYAQSTKAYSDAELDSMLEESGFEVVARYESLSDVDDAEAELFGLVAERMPRGES
ncbi:MAG: methyltransferase domain-containing protein [Myxococcota bacterium]